MLQLKFCPPNIIQTVHKNGIIGSLSLFTGLPSEMHIELLFENNIVWTRGGQVIVKGVDINGEIISTPTKGYFKNLIDEYFMNLKKSSNYKMNFKEAVMDLDIVSSCYRSAEKKEVVKFKVLGFVVKRLLITERVGKRHI